MPEEFDAYWKFLRDLIGDQKASEALLRFRELAKADRDGRVIVLPCKEGTKVYKISWRLNGQHEIEECVFNLTYFDPARYGRDYFLNHEEAEKALEEAKNNG